jgi:MFS family permease
MNHDGFGQLGFYILAVLYFCMAVGSLISTAVINRIGTKVCMILGGLGNTAWILSSILAAKYALHTHHEFFDSE